MCIRRVEVLPEYHKQTCIAPRIGKGGLEGRESLGVTTMTTPPSPPPQIKVCLPVRAYCCAKLISISASILPSRPYIYLST